MASTPKFYDRVMETSTTTGTGTLTLAGAVTGFQSFAALGDGNSCYYCAQDVDGNGNPSGGWEVGLGTYTAAGTTLSRDTILASSNSGSAVSWSAGTRRVFIVLPAGVTTAPMTSLVLGVPVLGAKSISFQQSNLATGDHDLYTVPTGKTAYVGGIHVYNNSGVGSIAFYAEVKISGTYYRLMNNSSCANGQQNPVALSYVLQAGDTLALNTGTNNGLNVQGSVIEFDSVSALKSARVLNPSAGDNTLYTCPSGKTAQLMPLASSFAFGNTSLGGVAFVNAAIATRNVKANVVPSGGSPGTGNQMTASSGIGASQRGILSLPLVSLSAGDFISVNLDSADAGQSLWLSVVEV